MNKKYFFSLVGGLIMVLLILSGCQAEPPVEVSALASGSLLSAATEADLEAPAQTSTGAQSGISSSSSLLADVPEPADATFRSQNGIQEGGRHFFFTSTEAPSDVVSDYGSALETAGWTIEDSGGGGDPFGFFGGAGLTATNEERYLKMHAGGPSGKTFIDICIWPQQPDDDDCDQDSGDNVTSGGDAALGSNAELLAGIPEPPESNFRAEDAIHENGRHFFYTSNATPDAIMNNYSNALEAAGWTIEDSGSGGDPWGLFGGGANLTATNEERYLKMNAGGPTGSTFVDVCVWPSQPDDDNCGQEDEDQNQSDSAFFGASGDLLTGVPEPAKAKFQAQNAIWEGGRHFWYTGTANPMDMINKYSAALVAAGWAIEDIGGGGDPFGLFGGGAGLTATNEDRYLTTHAGGPVGETYMDICVWPSKPSDDGCDQDAYAHNTSGASALGSDAELLDGVPELTGANFKAEDAIQEGGRHYFFTTVTSPANVVSGYEAALTDAGWSILDSGGDPFGLFGAGLTASDGTRYIKFNAGGPGGTTFIDACIWPARPSDDDCDQNNQSSGSRALGSSSNLLADVPEPADARFKAQDNIQENGRHFFYASTEAPADVASAYGAALEANGWTVRSSGGGGDPFGLFGSGAGLTATNDTRYLKMHAGGPTGSTFIDICVWPTEPNDDDCDQDSNRDTSGSNVLGESGDLLEGVPELEGANFQAEDAIQEGGRHFFWTSSSAPSGSVGDYQSALEDAGWEIVDSGGGGDPFGLFGGGANLTATDGTRVIKLNAGGPPGRTFIDGCIWPSEPVDDNCGQNDNDNNND